MDQPVSSMAAPPERGGLTKGETAPEIRRAIELLFFAYRDFTQDADAMLLRYGFGRAHHRVIYFVGRRPGIRVGELLQILKITKQSLAPVLAQLVEEGFIVQRRDASDRRRRRLYLTAEAEELERTLTARQAERIVSAAAEAGHDAMRGFTDMLIAIINREDRHYGAMNSADDGA